VKIQITKPKLQTNNNDQISNLLGSLDIEIWDLIGIWCLGFEISEYLNIRGSMAHNYISIEHSTVKFHTSPRKIGTREFYGYAFFEVETELPTLRKRGAGWIPQPTRRG
jgi:hypothetical protein